MSAQPKHFAAVARLLHWLMAVMIIAMFALCVGIFDVEGRRVGAGAASGKDLRTANA